MIEIGDLTEVEVLAVIEELDRMIRELKAGGNNNGKDWISSN